MYEIFPEAFYDLSKRIDHVIDNIFISGIEYDEHELILKNINYIINVSTFHKKPAFIDNYYQFNIIDSPEEKILPIIDEVTVIIDEAKLNNKNILIHCQMGVSRSISVLIGYLIKKNYSFNEAIDLVKSRRPEANPNLGFVCQLYSMSK